MQSSGRFHLAQLNLGRLRASIDSPEIAEFAGALDTINSLAESSAGFVWRLTGEANNATDVIVEEADPLLIPNMSVWESLDALRSFVYASDHTPFLRRRREWFETMDNFMVLWWIPAGTVPTLASALSRLAVLTEKGPTDQAFTFGKPFGPDGVALSPAANLSEPRSKRVAEPRIDTRSVATKSIAANLGPQIVAHRGASKAARENTREAFVLAREQGATMVELDVRRSGSGSLVVNHDPTFGDQCIIKTPDIDLPDFVLGLNAALDACSGMEVNIEIKNDESEPDFDASRSIATDVVALLATRGDGQRMLVSSFDRETIRRVRALEPSLRTGLLFIAPELPLDQFLLGIAAEGHVAVHPHRFAATTELCEAAHAVGLKVNAWTIDSPEKMLELAANGVDAIITNVPNIAVETFREFGGR